MIMLLRWRTRFADVSADPPVELALESGQAVRVAVAVPLALHARPVAVPLPAVAHGQEGGEHDEKLHLSDVSRGEIRRE